MNFSESFSHKLYVPRDIEGNLNSEVFRVIELIHESLINEPEFICADPFDSSMKGYGTSESDIDVCLYLDFKTTSTEDFIARSTEIHDRNQALSEKAKKYLESASIDIDNVHLISFYLDEAENRDRIKQKFSNDETDAFVVGSLFRKVSGSKISAYRDSAIKQMSVLPKNEQAELIHLMARALTDKERLSSYKIKTRVKEELDYGKIEEDRVALWEARINSFFR